MVLREKTSAKGLEKKLRKEKQMKLWKLSLMWRQKIQLIVCNVQIENIEATDEKVMKIRLKAN